MDNDILIKKSVCEYGNLIINNEMIFYKYIGNHIFLPKIHEFGQNYFKLSKIQNSKKVIDYFNTTFYEFYLDQ